MSYNTATNYNARTWKDPSHSMSLDYTSNDDIVLHRQQFSPISLIEHVLCFQWYNQYECKVLSSVSWLVLFQWAAYTFHCSYVIVISLAKVAFISLIWQFSLIQIAFGFSLLLYLQFSFSNLTVRTAFKY